MKKKKEETLPEEGCGTKMPAENEATNEVVNNENLTDNNAAESDEETDDDYPEDDEGGCMEIHAPGKDFLEFLSKLLRMMKEIILLEKRLREFEKDPTFNMLMDLCMVHLKEMEESDKDKESSDKNNGEDHKESCDDKEDHFDEDEDIVTEAFISMKVKKLRS